MKARELGRTVAAGFGLESRTSGRRLKDRVLQVALPFRMAYKDRLDTRGVTTRTRRQRVALMALGGLDAVTLASAILAPVAGVPLRVIYNGTSHFSFGPKN